MSEEITPKRRGRPPGSKTGRKCKRVADMQSETSIRFDVDPDLRTHIRESAERAGIPQCRWMEGVLRHTANGIHLPDDVMMKLKRSSPQGGTVQDWAVWLLRESIQKKGL